MGLRFQDIHHHYGSVPALSGVSLEAEAGEIVCLLGQSGCGKTTLLNLTAGTLRLQTGLIQLNEQVLASSRECLPPEKRPVGLVFQDGALFPHLTVAQNVGFGVKDKTARPHIVAELLEQIGLSGFEDRYPHTLSGGQKQRVAVARALAPQPAIVLMDEPFASIDIMLRRRLREEIRRVLKARGCTTILVTHDPEEAVETSDRIAVMEAGQISQFGSAQALYESPNSLLVGLMAGEGSVVAGRWSDGRVETAYGGLSAAHLKLAGKPKNGDRIDLLLRPKTIGLNTRDDGAMIIDVRRTGHSQIVTLNANGADPLLLEVSANEQCDVGQTVEIVFRGENIPAFLAEKTV